MNPYNHIDLRVTDLKRALQFYSTILPALGFTREYHSEEWKVFATEGELPGAAYFAITESSDHKPNYNRIAFAAESHKIVDDFSKVLQEADAKITAGPKRFAEYPGNYYAVYFEDPDGNKFELVYRTM